MTARIMCPCVDVWFTSQWFLKHFILSIIQFVAYEMTVAGAVWESFPI